MYGRTRNGAGAAYIFRFRRPNTEKEDDDKNKDEDRTNNTQPVFQFKKNMIYLTPGAPSTPAVCGPAIQPLRRWTQTSPDPTGSVAHWVSARYLDWLGPVLAPALSFCLEGMVGNSLAVRVHACAAHYRRPTDDQMQHRLVYGASPAPLDRPEPTADPGL